MSVRYASSLRWVLPPGARRCRRSKRSDCIGNAPYGISLPNNYVHLDDWNELGRGASLEVVDRRLFRFNLLDDCPHIFFELNVQPQESAGRGERMTGAVEEVGSPD